MMGFFATVPSCPSTRRRADSFLRDESNLGERQGQGTEVMELVGIRSNSCPSSVCPRGIDGLTSLDGRDARRSISPATQFVLADDRDRRPTTDSLSPPARLPIRYAR